MNKEKYEILNENDLKEKLQISNWNQLSKEKFVNFLNLIPSTDPEVIKNTIAQFPQFAKMTKEMFVELRDFGNKAVDSGDKSYVSFVNQCNTVISVITKKLDNEKLTPKQEQQYFNELHDMMELLAKKEAEHKNFLLKVLGLAGGAVVGCLSIAFAILTNGKVEIPFIKKN